MKITYDTKRFLKQILLVIIFIMPLTVASLGNAENVMRVWSTGRAEPVSFADAERYFQSITAKKKMSGMSLQGNIAPLSYSVPVTDEITELARALENNPKLIYEFVHNTIDYTPYFGALKGPTLTLMDGAGNDCDQAALMIALLRASGYTANFMYGMMTIPGNKLAQWLGVEQNVDIITRIIASGGIPGENFQADGTCDVARIWVKATINGTDYVFDPAFKTYNVTPKIDIAQALGYNRTDFLNNVLVGATQGSDYVKNLNETNMRSKLTTYSSNLINAIKTSYPNSDIKEIVGGFTIVPEVLSTYQTTLPFLVRNDMMWTSVPDAYVTTLRVQHVGIDYTCKIPNITGKRLTITYSATMSYAP
jgi:hypothetical protein